MSQNIKQRRDKMNALTEEREDLVRKFKILKVALKQNHAELEKAKTELAKAVEEL